ncbi:MAG: helix-turn-helix transcriptional regulator [Clostridia bacterium]|nr:helix-turn-helix transcriptional regulator [Clostridia bacterium]
MTLSQAIIDRILKLQQERKITTNKLATLSGLAQPTVRDVLYGVSKAPKINTLLHICEGLNINLREFFDDSIFDNVVDEENDDEI